VKSTKRQQEQTDSHPEDIRSKATQEIQELEGVAQESLSQKLPEQKVVFKADSLKFFGHLSPWDFAGLYWHN